MLKKRYRLRQKSTIFKSFSFITIISTDKSFGLNSYIPLVVKDESLEQHSNDPVLMPAKTKENKFETNR